MPESQQLRPTLKLINEALSLRELDLQLSPLKPLVRFFTVNFKNL